MMRVLLLASAALGVAATHKYSRGDEAVAGRLDESESASGLGCDDAVKSHSVRTTVTCRLLPLAWVDPRGCVLYSARC